MKRRVYFSVALLLLAKLFTIAVPYSFKWATDALTAPEGTNTHGLWPILAGPLALALAYGVLRIGHGFIHANTRCHFRRCRDACGAASG